MSSRIVEVMTPPTIGAAIRFITSAPAPWLNMIGIKAGQDNAHRHDLGADAFHRAEHDGIFQISSGFQQAFLFPFFIGKIKIEEHHHARLRIEAGKGDDAHPDGNAHIVIEQIQEPEGTDQRKRHGKQNDDRLGHRFRIQIDQHKNDQQRKGNDQLQPLMCFEQIFVFAAPVKPIAFRNFQLPLLFSASST